MTHALDKAPSQRIHDLNGWFQVRGNPLSKVGIYDYSGAQIGAPPEDADKIFRVYRPAEELGSADTIDSFKLVPFIDDHTMLGDGFTSVDDRPVGGVIGEDVYFEDGVLYGNPKVYSEALAQNIKSGKTELSLGYRCRYDFTPGVWNGEAYDVIQRDLRGNHVALVDEGRMGPEVSILDQMTFAVDAKELKPVDEEIKEMLAAILARLDVLEGKGADEETPAERRDNESEGENLADREAREKAADEDPDKTGKDEDVPSDTEVAEKAEEVAELADDLHEIATELNSEIGTDAKLKAKVSKILTGLDKLKSKATMDSKTTAKLRGKLKALDTRPVMDERSIVATMAARTSLYERLSTHVGAFDHANMTHADIAQYGIKKLGIAGVAKGHEIVALDAYLQAKGKPTATTSVAEDKAPTGLAARLNSLGAGE